MQILPHTKEIAQMAIIFMFKVSIFVGDPSVKLSNILLQLASLGLQVVPDSMAGIHPKL